MLVPKSIRNKELTRRLEECTVALGGVKSWPGTWQVEQADKFRFNLGVGLSAP